MSSYGAIRGVTFDAGGTLIAPWPSVGDIYSEIAKGHGYGEISPLALNHRFAVAWKRKKSFSHERAQWRALVRQTFAGLTPADVSEEFFTELYAYFGRAVAWRVFDDVLVSLDELQARGFKLAVVSNWDERLRPLLNELDLSRYFHALSISTEVGATKPDKLIFDHAGAVLGLGGSALLHVGDSLVEDYQGAQHAGFSSILLDRGAAASSGGVIRSLTELAGLLEKPL